MSFNIRSPLTKTLDRSVEKLGRECNLCSVISFIQQNQNSTYYVGLYTWLRYSHKFRFKVIRMFEQYSNIVITFNIIETEKTYKNIRYR